MKKVISFAVLFAAFFAAPASLADSSSSATQKLGMVQGSISSINHSAISCGDRFKVKQLKSDSPATNTIPDRVRANMAHSVGSAKE